MLKKYLAEGMQSDKDWDRWAAYNCRKKSFNELVEELTVRKEKETNDAKGKTPTDVWMKNNNTAAKEYAGWHPAQKPIEIIDRIIKAQTVEGDCRARSHSAGSGLYYALGTSQEQWSKLSLAASSNGDYVSKSPFFVREA